MKVARYMVRVAVIAALCALTLAPVAHAQSSGPGDSFSNAQHLQYGTLESLNDVWLYGVENQEGLTWEDQNDTYCIGHFNNGTEYHFKMFATSWWHVFGSGRPVTVSSQGSNFDTVLSVWQANTTSGHEQLPPNELSHNLGCNDDGTGNTGHTSKLTFDSKLDDDYYVQLGCYAPATMNPDGCDNTYVQFGADSFVNLQATTPAPGNDAKSAAATLSGASTSGDTYGATTEQGEALKCGTSTYGATVWYRWHAATKGTATFTVKSTSGGDTAAAVYDSAGKQLGCDDVTGAGDSRVAVPVTGGDYLIQVGSHNYGDSIDQSPFSLSVGFSEDPDRDGDGDPNSSDCQPDNPNVGKTRPEIVNNDVDENCDGVKAQDADGDGALAAPAGNDCVDTDKSIHPGAVDVPGDGIDQDCANGKAVLKLAGLTAAFLRGGLVLIDGRPFGFVASGFSMRGLRPGSTVTGRCPLRKCRFTFTAKGKSRKIRFPGGPRRLPRNLTFLIKTYKPGHSDVQGVYFRLRASWSRGTLTCTGPLKPGSATIQGRLCRPAK